MSDALFDRELKRLVVGIGIFWTVLFAARLYAVRVEDAQQRGWCATHDNADIKCSAYAGEGKP